MSEQGKRKPATKDKAEVKDRYAKAALSPSLYASAVIQQYGNALFGKDNMDMHCLEQVIREAIEAINNGDMKAVEAMLYGRGGPANHVYQSGKACRLSARQAG